jgi:hypothetical protein
VPVHEGGVGLKLGRRSLERDLAFDQHDDAVDEGGNV